MTRAALLSLLASPTALSAVAVQDLEQLAQAFPYCQTAHLLLAKAAHDQGSMLAGQRLRRAATYAADRQLLRQLLEQPAGGETADFIDSGVELSAAPLEAPTATQLQPEATTQEEKLEIQATAVEAAEATVAEDVTVSTDSLALLTPHVELEAAPGPETGPELLPAELLAVEPAQVTGASAAQAAPAEPLAEVSANAKSEAEPADETSLVPTGQAAPELLPAEPAEALAAPGAPLPVPDDALSMATVEADQAAIEAEPDSGPLPIRPSAEAGTARFEFGLSSALANEFAAYQLSDLPAEAAKQLPRSAAEPADGLVFTGSSETPYALSGGSRLGYALLGAPPADGSSPRWATAEPPATALPPASEFFPPDALLLEFLAVQPPSAPPAPSPVDLIDSFLRRAPQRRRGIVTLLTVPEQADLSMRSTQAEPDLASESLARILAGQGKTERAISVYERLMVRQPEKSAYFAVQIELLRNPPTPSS